MKTYKLVLASAALLGFAAGCSSSTSTAPGTTGKPLISAKSGSTFTLEITKRDSMGNDVAPPISQFDSVVATGVTYMGKSNVVQIAQTANGQKSIGYYALLDNGDMEFYLGASQAGIKTQWLTLPFGTGSPTTTTIMDTTIITGPVSQQTSETATFTHGSPINITVQGNTVAADGVLGEYVTTQKWTSSGTVVLDQKTNLPDFNYYWSRDIGFIVKSQATTADPFGNKTYITQLLTSYSVK